MGAHRCLRDRTGKTYATRFCRVGFVVSEVRETSTLSGCFDSADETG